MMQGRDVILLAADAALADVKYLEVPYVFLILWRPSFLLLLDMQALSHFPEFVRLQFHRDFTRDELQYHLKRVGASQLSRSNAPRDLSDLGVMQNYMMICRKREKS